jgi:hypothetical protein
MTALPIDDVFPDETTMIVKKRFHSGETVYPYAVSKLNGSWFVTGPMAKGKAYTWDELLGWMSAGILVSAKVAAEYTTVLAPAIEGARRDAFFAGQVVRS